MQLPRLVEIEQKLHARKVRDIPAAVAKAWKAAGCARRVRGGARVGITVGSRGIDNIAAITRAVVAMVKESGGRPFILPAMGSHGGATPEGQTKLLGSLGVTPQSVGAPIRASMATERVGKTTNGVAVYTSREALGADGLVVLNRVKQHTDYAGDYESGLVKMLAVGLGKREGAAAMHSRRVASLQQDIPEAAQLLLRRLPVIAGIAILENGHHRTADIVGMPPSEIMSRERLLLRRARRNAARLPFRELDLLLVDWIGKDISGVGFDTHVIGRRMVWGEPDFGRVRIGVVAALDLTPGSQGNTLGMGLADLVTRRLTRKIDWNAVVTNVLHTGFLNRAKLPIVLPNDRRLIEAALTALGRPKPGQVRIARIASTLQLDRIWVSEALLPQVRGHRRLTQIGGSSPLQFDQAGNLARLTPPD